MARKTAKKLVEIFTGAAMLALAHGGLAAAQEAPAPVDAASARVAAQDDAYKFKPRDICLQSEAQANVVVKQTASEGDAFTALDRWVKGPDAAAIITYHLCQAGDQLLTRGDDVTSDVLRRANKEPWLLPLLQPFFLADPAFYQKAVAIGIIPYGGSREKPAVNVWFSDDLLKAAAADPARADRILNLILFDWPGEQAAPAAAQIVQLAVHANPLLMFSYSGSITSRFGQLPLADEEMGESLLALSHDPAYSASLMNRYEKYAHLPQAADIMRNAVAADPVGYLRAIQYDRNGIDPEFAPSAQQLLNAAAKPGNTYDIVSCYEGYAHMPQAADILKASGLANPHDFLDALARLRDRAPAAILALLPPAERMIEDIGAHPQKTQSFIKHYDLYKAMPGARDVLQAAIDADPALYIEYYTFRMLPDSILANGKPPLPKAEKLLAAARDRWEADRIFMAYELYKDLPEAQEIARAAIDTRPILYISALDNGKLPPELKRGEFMPDAVTLLRGLADRDHDAYNLMIHYKAYAHIPQAREVLQAAIDKAPLDFFVAKEKGELPVDVAQDSTLIPSAAVLLQKASDGDGRIALYYHHYSALPQAPEIFAAAIDHAPADVLWRLIDRSHYYQQPGSPAAETEKKDATVLAAFRYLFDHHRPLLEKEMLNMGRLSMLTRYIILAGDDQEILDFFIALGDKNPAGVLRFLASPANAGLIEKLGSARQEKLLAMLPKTVDEKCGYDDTDSFSMLFEQGSWLGRGDRLETPFVASMSQCLAARAPNYMMDLLKNYKGDLFKDPKIVEQVIGSVVTHAPVTFLARLTKEGLANDLEVRDVNVPFADLAAAGRQFIITQHSQKNDKNSDGYWNYRDTGLTVISILNSLHNYGPETRFALAADLPADLYLDLIIRRDEYYYTSTFNFLMDRVLEGMKTDPALKAKLFAQDKDNSQRQAVNDPLRSLLLNAMHFGRLEDLLAQLTEDETQKVAESILGSLSGEGLDYYYYDAAAPAAATALQVVTHIARAGHAEAIEQAIINGFRNPSSSAASRSALGMVAALYSRAEGVGISEGARKFFDQAAMAYLPVIDNYLRTDMKVDDLFDEQGRNFQMMVFYNDEDGQSSFSHFVEQYRGDRRWDYSDHGEYISFARGGITLYANKPQFERSGNDKIAEEVRAQGGRITVLVHRGHSYHVDDTSRRYLNKDVGFYWLGSCRSSDAWHYIDEAPDMQFIYSQNVGTMLVNDPLLKAINDNLAAGRDVNWLEMREKARRLARGDKRVDDYIFPDGSHEYALRMALSYYNGKQAEAVAVQTALAGLVQQGPDEILARPRQQQGVAAVPPQGPGVQGLFP